MFHTTNPVSKLSKSQQYRATYKFTQKILFCLPVILPILILMAGVLFTKNLLVRHLKQRVMKLNT